MRPDCVKLVLPATVAACLLQGACLHAQFGNAPQKVMPPAAARAALVTLAFDQRFYTASLAPQVMAAPS